MKKKQDGNKIIATNKKAYHDYFIEDTLEAGIALEGHEVKSLRLNNVNMKDSFAIVKNGEVFLVGMHISPYKMATMFKIDPMRNRRLLLHKSEIRKLKQKVEQKGYTLVPTKLYFMDALVKVELGVARGKELHDKRDAIQEKENNYNNIDFLYNLDPNNKNMNLEDKKRNQFKAICSQTLLPMYGGIAILLVIFIEESHFSFR